jgi:hypothetical protein
MTANRSIPVDYSMNLCELYWTVLARCQSADARFALIVQQALGLTTLSIRECAAIGPYQNTRPILSEDAFFRSAPATPLTRIGMISKTEELLTDATSDMTSLKENVHFIRTISTDEKTIPRLYSGITTNQVQSNDVLYSLDDIPELLVILRWIEIVNPKQTRVTKRETTLSELLNNRTFIRFAISGDFSNLNFDQLAMLSNTLYRMKLTSTKLATKGIRPIYPDDDISA